MSPRPSDACPGRRRALALGGAAALAALAPRATWARMTAPDPLLDDLERRAFAFFQETTDRATGLTPDRWPTPSAASVGVAGFALSAWPIGVARGYVTREQARERVLATLRFFHDAPQGPQASGMAGYKGFYYHFLDRRTGAREGRCELSTIDTALLLAGALHCREAFDAAHADEQRIRDLADAIYARVDWRWAQPRAPWLAHGWTPEGGFLPYDWQGYSEGMIAYLLALGAPVARRAIGADAWSAWTSTYDTSPMSGWVHEYGQTYLRFPPLFGHQFTHCWVDFRGLRDAYMRARGIDYFENSRRATYAQRAYAVANPERWVGYGADVWGVTACDGPARVDRVVAGRRRSFRAYAGRGMGGAALHDDGTIAPYAAGSSIAFAPEIALPALQAMRERYPAIYGRYGYYAFNPSFTFTDAKLRQGLIVPGVGWVDNDFLGVEVGPLLAMLANHRGELVWRTTSNNGDLMRGLQRAGFAGAWLD